MLCTKIQRTTTPCLTCILRNVRGALRLRPAGLRALSVSAESSAQVVGSSDSEEGVQSQSGKPRCNVPFAKNLFLGKIDQVSISIDNVQF